MKKIIMVTMIIILTCSLCACGENEKITQTKECVDTIYKEYDGLYKAEKLLENNKSKEEKEIIERDIRIYNSLIESDLERFSEYYSELSEGGKEQINEYIEQISAKKIFDSLLK